MKILVLGVTGMLGSAIYKLLAESYDTWGTLRNPNGRRFFAESLHDKLICNIDVLNQDKMVELLTKVRPEIVINCVGIIKQLTVAKDPLIALPLNALFPHRLAKLCDLLGSRLIHISTDCVFSGQKGNYVEEDISDAHDLYGKSKFMGEMGAQKHCVTLRTSIIGHELQSNYSLVEWFLSQEHEVKGFSRTVFSGLPTIELALVIRDFVIPNYNLYGLYHVSSSAIDKFSLLKLIAETYKKNIPIIKDTQLAIDRSLNSKKFRNETGYKPEAWPELINKMFRFNANV